MQITYKHEINNYKHVYVINKTNVCGGCGGSGGGQQTQLNTLTAALAAGWTKNQYISSITSSVLLHLKIM